MAKPTAVSSNDEDEGPDSARVPSIAPPGPRKLIRPSLPTSLLDRRTFKRRDLPLLSHQQTPVAPFGHLGSSHAEVFYLQKQMQAQTHMVFVLEDGERVEGAIEWYDTHTIKVRNGHHRTLIYKAVIKYLHKASDPQ